MEVNIHHAKTNLSKLIAAAESGEEVIIARNGKPAVKLVLVTPPVRKSRKHMLGSGIGKIWMADDAFSSEADLEIQKLFEPNDPLLDFQPGPNARLSKKPNEGAGRKFHLKNTSKTPCQAPKLPKIPLTQTNQTTSPTKIVGILVMSDLLPLTSKI